MMTLQAESIQQQSVQKLNRSPKERVTFKTIDSERSASAINNEKIAENYDLESV